MLKALKFSQAFMRWLNEVSGVLESENDQSRMAALYMFFGPRMQYLVSGVRPALAVFVFGYLLFYGCGAVASTYDVESSTQALGFPRWITFLALPVTFVVMMAARILDPLAKQSEEHAVVKIEEGVS